MAIPGWKAVKSASARRQFVAHGSAWAWASTPTIRFRLRLVTADPADAAPPTAFARRGR